MAFEVKSLLEGKPAPVIAGPEEPAMTAFNRMRAQNFSQLPVVEQERVLGIVSHESVLRAVVTFGCGLERLTVRDAMTRHRWVAPDAGMAELLEALGQAPAVLVVDREGGLAGMVTDYDVTQYFRTDLEDRMNLVGIEQALREFVAAGYGGEDTEELRAAIRARSGLEHREPFARALRAYLGEGTPVDGARERAAFDAHFSRERRFDELTMGEYLGLFADKRGWDARFAALFGDKRDEIHQVLDRARLARNDVAHLRDLRPEQRETVGFCADWLERVRDAEDRPRKIGFDAGTTAPATGDSTVTTPRAVVPAESQLEGVPKEPPPVDSLAPDEGSYAPLAAWLQARDAAEREVTVSFVELEGLLGRDLPPSARRHRAWWANDTRLNAHAQAWLDVGWKASPNLTAEQVRFTRTAGLEDAYIRFFSALCERLRQEGFPVAGTPGGGSFLWVEAVEADGGRVGWLAVSFLRGGRVRAELYLDGGEKEANKACFDKLAQSKDEIGQRVGAELAWERLDEERTSRVARYREGRVTDPPEVTATLRGELVKDLLAMKAAFAEVLGR